MAHEMKTNGMDIYELLKEENQRFWEFLDIELLSLAEVDLTLLHESYIVEEIETI